MENQLKEETIQKIKEINEKLKSSNNELEKMLITHHELNPLILLFGELVLKENAII
jgi:hypothetical protein